MKITLLLFFSLFTGYLVYAQWEPQSSGTDEELNSVCFIYENIGWACGFNGTVLFTDDGGTNWEMIPAWTELNMVSVFFTNNLKGWILARNEDEDHSEVFYTDDGGQNWISQVSLDKYCYKLFFIDESNGWIAGESAVWRTIDGGTSWTTQSSGLPDIFYTSVYFINPNMGWAIGTSYTEADAYRSFDGGLSWEEMILPEDGYKESVFFLDENTGWITCNKLFTTPYGIIMKTTDGGNTWDITFEELGYWFKEIFFTTENTGWVVGAFSEGMAVCRTDDSGYSWGGSSYWYNWTNEIQIKNDVGWVVGDYGAIVHNNNLLTGDNYSSIAKEMSISIDCYPNPIKSQTTIEISIPKQVSIDLFIYSSTGILIEKIIDGEKYQAGTHRFNWNIENSSAKTINSGIYYYKLVCNNQVNIKKVIMIK